MKRILLLLCSAALALGLQAAHAGVTATLEPSQVAVGEPAQLTVTVDGSSSAEPSIPDVPGLDITRVSQQTQISMTNGSISASSVETYEVTPERAGTFRIPAIQAGGAKSNPLTLRVSGSGGTNPSGGSSQSSAGAANLPPPNVQMPPADPPAPEDSRYGFIQLAVPKKDFYVGELVPVDIETFVPAGVQATYDGPPTLDSQGFALNELGEKPQQSQRIAGGRQYVVLTWHSAITAIKPGDFSLRLQMPLTVIIRQKSFGNGLFDQFFNDPNALRGVQKEVTLSNEPTTLTVQPLPAANRPADFSGAVGHFDVQAGASPTKVTAGDPITLRLELSGSGDFDRAASEMLAASNSWKTYPPKSSFQAEDSAGYKGTKTFEQLVIPEDASLKEIPPLHFTFFDPKTRQYETRHTAAIPVSVTGAPANVLAGAAPVGAGAQPAFAAPDLVPNKVDSGHFVATLRPVFVDPWFVAAQGLPLCALAGGLLFISRKRRFAADPRLVRASAAERAIRAQLDRMDQAMHQRASAEFFFSARSALQQRLGERWNVRPETITLTEINARMNGASDGIRPIFEMADQVSYSGQNLGEADYRQWKELVVAQLKALEKES